MLSFNCIIFPLRRVGAPQAFLRRLLVLLKIRSKSTCKRLADYVGLCSDYYYYYYCYYYYYYYYCYY